MQCGVGIAFLSVGASHYSVVANATLPQDVHVARAHATSKALFLLVSVSSLVSESSTANSVPEGIWRVTVSYSSRGPFLRLNRAAKPAEGGHEGVRSGFIYQV